MDDDLERMSLEELSAEVKKLRDGIRAHRNGDPWALASLSVDRPLDPAELLWTQFCGGCLPAAPQPRSVNDHTPPRPIVPMHFRRLA